MAASLSEALKTLFILLACVMAAALVYLTAIDHWNSCFAPNWWLPVAIYYSYINLILMAAWFFYKESCWIKTLVFLSMLFWTGSFLSCSYIVIQLFKLSPEESSKDPLYFALARHQKGGVMGHTKRRYHVTAKVIVAALGCYVVGVTLYACIVEGSPYQVEVLNPCMITTLIDNQIHVVIFSVWIAHKESSWMSAIGWILLLECFGSVTLCVYILRQLFHLSPQQPISLILFNQHRRDLITSEPLLTEHSNV